MIRCEAIKRDGLRCSITASKKITNHDDDTVIRVCGNHLLVFYEYLSEFSSSDSMRRIVDGTARVELLKETNN